MRAGLDKIKAGTAPRINRNYWGTLSLPSGHFLDRTQDNLLLAVAAILAALIMVLGGCLTTTEAYRAINWESVILIAAMIPNPTAAHHIGV